MPGRRRAHSTAPLTEEKLHLLEMLLASEDAGECARHAVNCQVSWVLLPEMIAVEEAKDAVAALARDGIQVAELVANRIDERRAPDCVVCRRRARYERTVLANGQRAFRGVRIRTMPALVDEPRGLATLGRLGRRLLQPVVNMPAVRSRNGFARSVDDRARRAAKKRRAGSRASPRRECVCCCSSARAGWARRAVRRQSRWR